MTSLVEFLGQSGFRVSIAGVTIYIDPYLSDSVQLLDAPDLERQIPVPVSPGAIKDADWVLITHAHIDHCDPHTLPAVAEASPACRFIGPPTVLERLRQWKIDEWRLISASESWMELSAGVKVCAVPAAHPDITRGSDGALDCVGFVIEEPATSQRAYFSGDTGVTGELIDAVSKFAPYDIAFLPVNEQNYFRARRGIIGNMSVREAFGFAEEIGAARLFPCHWDMFSVNSAYPDEIYLLYDKLSPSFALESGSCVSFPKAKRLASIVIRTLNEAAHLDDLLTVLDRQKTSNLDWEFVLVDSGSTDGTIEIAKRHSCRIVHITRDQFSFGRSLNLGCSVALGDILVFISGHCVPADEYWLQRLCEPVVSGSVSYCYGRQVGDDDSNFSERRIFAKYYPAESRIPQEDFYCNNANSALLKAVWNPFPFNEDLTGLEDIDLGKRLSRQGHRVGYMADATVFHHHKESWSNVRRRFQRESIALQQIMPEVHLSKLDVARYIFSSVWMDWRSAARHGHLLRSWREVLLYRINQYVGSYLGNHDHRKLSQEQKESFFYPSTNDKDETNEWLQSHRRIAPNEGEQRTS